MNKFTKNNEIRDTLKAEDLETVNNNMISDNRTSSDASLITDALITLKSQTGEKPISSSKPVSDPYDSDDPIDEAITQNVITGELLKPYLRQAMYYETDQMGIIHHSNYIRWFEESRVYFLEQIGLSYDKLEENGILIPVLSVSCEYKSSVHFNEKVIILPKVIFFNGFKMTIQYKIADNNVHTLKAWGESRHCFVNKDFKPINLKKNYKDIYDILTSWIN